ncbi:MAG: hypothetical protein ACRDU8_02835, partial [Egibacteraceae bacterium]
MRPLPSVVFCAVALVAVACSDARPVADVQAERRQSAVVSAAVESDSATQPDDLVDLTVYFRDGDGRSARLAPVTREVPV